MSQSKNTPTAARNKDGTFKKGSSGNPQGRPKRSDLEKAMLAEIYLLAPQAVSSLKKLLASDDTPANVRLKAVEIVLNRVCGTAMNPDDLEEYEEKIRFDFGSVSMDKLSDSLLAMFK